MWIPSTTVLSRMAVLRSLLPGPRGVLAGAASAAAAAAVFGWTAAPGPQPAATLPRAGQQEVRYGRDIRPILADRCFTCHGPDDKTRQAELRLDLREEAVADRGGYAVIVPGDPEQSELWLRITTEAPLDVMPPKDSNKRPLSAEELELVRRWIEQGAPYEPHWAFVPPQRPPLPEAADPVWAVNPVDRFLRAELERHGVAPNAPAERETLLRRLFLDLTGLPPTPEELDAFLADARPDAYERWVHKLFTEEPYRGRYAERMAVPWLDAARYADTSGIHMDAGRQMWLWRDWVLAAFRDGMPFDQFLIEQLAGDLLPDASEAQKIASGFNRNHVTTDEGGAIADEYLVEYAVDRAATTGSVFLGLTLGCARCHEHKFDPISQEEFFRFYAYFNSIEEPGLYSQLPDPNRAFEPFLAVPTAAQKQELVELRRSLERANGALATADPGEEIERRRFFAELPERAGAKWADSELLGAEASGGAVLTVQADGSVLASGPNPDQDEHLLRLRTKEQGLRLLLLEALADPSLVNGRVGRAENGNAVLSGVTVEAVSLRNRQRVETVRFRWAWADFEQADGDFGAVNVLDPDERGWAVDGHRREGNRALLLLAEQPFGFPGGTELRVRLQYRSVYARHTLGRVRVHLAALDEPGLALLPAAASGWYLVGPFPGERSALYAAAHGPESGEVLDFERNFGAGNQYWRHVVEYADGRLNGGLPEGSNVTYVGRHVYAPSARRLPVSLGSDDGFRLFVNGVEVAQREVDRALAADQDQAEIELRPGRNAVVLKIVNTGGLGGFYYRPRPPAEVLSSSLVAALLPAAARWPALEQAMASEWKLNFSPGYRQKQEEIAGLQQRIAGVEQQVPRTMVMQELAAPRATFVLKRGQYDLPDPQRPVSRGVPAALGQLPPGAPPNRLGLAQWLVAADNPLVARVAVNRLWELVFGTELVRTTEDFGMQGEWPSHPELLDWLAVEFRESGWNTRHILTLLLTSNAYRQSSRARPELRDLDPENRWLAYFPRKRLGAEQIRDQALYVAGLLVEQLGGASVKPYQPEGLWQEVAMLQSNTREYQRGAGDDLWRRSLYTYWKRACPPPSLLTLDAPTREFCNIRRTTTNTPLQALVLWNDEQFVEAARELAERTLDGPGGDGERLRTLFRRCTGRAPRADEQEKLVQALAAFRARYAAAAEDAAKLLEVGEAPYGDALDPAELAAWTMVANAVLNLDAAITRS